MLGQIEDRRMRESFPMQVDKKSRSPQGEEGSGILKEEERTNFFFPLHSLGLYNNNVSCLRTVSEKNLLANPVILNVNYGSSLVMSLQPPDILLIHCNN